MNRVHSLLAFENRAVHMKVFILPFVMPDVRIFPGTISSFNAENQPQYLEAGNHKLFVCQAVKLLSVVMSKSSYRKATLAMSYAQSLFK